ncbi:hypothetical protein VMCG_01814 [Cytospora schulzeri]|uniref:Uncharacterized protein n=1 Tax=Cytospora schulzeri TaxID=448051 RepID=A0A423X2T9_9PEZI|nr:hypothetical protein VMCG_01814 [Valsa malicola]
MAKLPRNHRCHRHIWSTVRYDGVVEGITRDLPAHRTQVRLFYRDTIANAGFSRAIAAPTYKPTWGDGRYGPYEVRKPTREIDSQSSAERVADDMETTIVPTPSIAHPAHLGARHGHHDLARIQPLVVVYFVRVRGIRPATTKVIEEHDPVTLLGESFSKIGERQARC